MPTVKSSKVLADTYAATTELIRKRDFPSDIIFANRTLFRQIDPTRPYSKLTRPAPGGHVSKLEAFSLFIPSDGQKSVQTATGIDDGRNQNRFSGVSQNPSIPASAGLYFSLQQQALVNETKHYRKKDLLEERIEHVFDGRCVLRIRVMGVLHVADLSPHNIGSKCFFDSLGKDIWKQVQDPDDCSVSRGIGLAIANSGFLAGLIAQTVRISERSSEERGDNLLLFARPGNPIRGLSLEAATFYDKGKVPETFPAAFP